MMKIPKVVFVRVTKYSSGDEGLDVFASMAEAVEGWADDHRCVQVRGDRQAAQDSGARMRVTGAPREEPA